MRDMNFNVTIHFSNGISLERGVSLSKAVKLSSKSNVIIPLETEYVEIKGMNDSLIVPLNMTFVVNVAPEFKHVDRISRHMLYRRDKGRCGYCGKDLTIKEATIDHILPKSQGGESTWENVALACRRCNCAKDNRTPEQAGMKLRVNPYNPKRKRKENQGYD